MDFVDWQTGCILNFHKIFDIYGIRKAEQTKGGEDISIKSRNPAVVKLDNYLT